MKLSTKGRYGLRAIIDLARYSETEPVSISSIAARQEISERYLEQLVALMKKAGLVKKAYDGVKVLGDGELTKKLTVKAAAYSKAANEKIEAAGGKAEVI